ncbi:MAG: hypothetical protein HYR70_07915 [Chloroflexi bacterium]|nr:hypothetical protein [Chloroflexota bacterium]
MSIIRWIALHLFQKVLSEIMIMSFYPIGNVTVECANELLERISGNSTKQ